MLADTFFQKIMLQIIDKIALGGIILIIGYFVNRALERYKSNQAVREAIEKKRIEMIAPLWQKLNDIHVIITNKFNIEGLISDKEKLDLLNKEYIEKETLATESLREQRFWLGKELYDKQKKYLNTIKNLKHTVEEFQNAVKTKGSVKILGEKMMADQNTAQAAFLDIDQVLNILTNSKI